MRFLRFQNAALALSLLAVAGFVANTTAPVAYSQSNVTGGLSGVVHDQTGAVVPGATVVVTDTATDAKQTVKSNAEGRYTVGQLKPGLYKIYATAESLKSDTIQVTVILGTTVPGDIQVTPTGSNTIVEVTSTTQPLLDTQNVALATTFGEDQIQNLPTPGGDVTTVAFTAPGVVVNVGGGYGNFSSDGLPGISNLFVLNGFDNQDPFLNLNNSGSSNLTLGQGELADATVIQNAYNSQYGRAAGAIIQYTTKSGTNRFHGEADYNYNGSALNANGWFNEFDQVSQGQPNQVPHAVSNEWAANVGGPIIKDRLWFFSDYEGLHYVLPAGSGFVTFPTPALATYIEGNVPAAAQGLYTQALTDFTKSPAYKSAIPVTNGPGANQDGNGNLGCGGNDLVQAADPTANPPSPNLYLGGLVGTPAPGGGTFGVDTPCMLVGTASVNNINIEWLFTQRVDWNISDKHKIYGRFKVDHGSQPTSTSVIDPLFSAVSIQPEYEGQFNDTYLISPNKTNVFVAAANWYSAYFGPVNVAASTAELPIDMYITDDGLDGSGVNSSPGLPSEGVPFYLTQGRNVTQYQIEDDFTWIKGKHTMKFGANFRRDLVEDYDSQINVVYPYTVQLSLGDFASGVINPGAGAPITATNTSYWGYNRFENYNQSFTPTPTAHLALYNIGMYFQDEFQATPRLKLTMGLRVDRTGNPLCHDNCFSAYAPGTFPASGASLTTPYISADGGSINAAGAHPFPSVELANVQPRFGFNYGINDKTEVRGGVGLFSDLYPAGFLDGVVQNFPNVYAASILSGAIAPSGPGTTGAFAAAANTAVQSAFTSGGSTSDINNALFAQGVPFTPPSFNAYFPGEFKVPEYLEYSLQIQRQLSKSDAIIITYAGNYGFREVIQNPNLNASAGQFTQDGNGGSWATSSEGPFAGLPSVPADPRFSRVTAYTNNAHSNYNGGMVTYKRNGHGITGEISYTYSHALDFVSDGGTGENFGSAALLTQLTPSLGAGNLNYSNADYDIRSNFVGDVVYEEPFKSTNKFVDEFVGGWVVGLKTYARTGTPFSISNGAVLDGYPTTGVSLMPDLAPGVTRSTLVNETNSNPHYCVNNPCMNIAQFGDQVDFGNLRRNSLYGPHYTDTDVSLLKKIVKTEGLTLQIGANAYNIFNHVNFAPPTGDTSSGAFGLITGAVAPPTSPYGSFQGAAVTQRLLQVHGKITF